MPPPCLPLGIVLLSCRDGYQGHPGHPQDGGSFSGSVHQGHGSLPPEHGAVAQPSPCIQGAQHCERAGSLPLPRRERPCFHASTANQWLEGQLNGWRSAECIRRTLIQAPAGV
ncbi:hypothetical protein KC19_2G234300 [Ceratodon purpureus]|uniref:Uncharacterized protein n=1 Tax=Ceratodon purpureus TaxID=3225 RepID=A0A8T0IZB5_CERPU|nr:hypothetical protein KC19_2G234300 [Ceratodon purpureus]